MAKIYNDENNICIEMNLFKNHSLDIEELRDDFENWIPFELLIIVEDETIGYDQDADAAFSVRELKDLITNFDNVIKTKLNKEFIRPYEFYSCEAYFGIVVYDPMEEDLLYMDFWLNMGSLTNGKSSGYQKGFRFVVSLASFIEFTNDLKKQMMEIFETIK
jgi:hypothetical protein